jgi:hypothetical protein
VPDYTSLSTQIDGFKSELTALYASGQMTAKDLIYIAKALNELGTLLGVDDIAAATADGVSTLSTAQTNATSAITTAQSSATTAVSSAQTTATGAITTAQSSAITAITSAQTTAVNTISNAAAGITVSPLMLMGA